MVTVSDGKSTKDLTLTPLTVGVVDPAANTVSGTAVAGSGVGVEIGRGRQAALRHSDRGRVVRRLGTKAGDEDWQGVYDIRPGTEGKAFQEDGEGDETEARCAFRSDVPDRPAQGVGQRRGMARLRRPLQIAADNPGTKRMNPDVQTAPHRQRAGSLRRSLAWMGLDIRPGPR